MVRRYTGAGGGGGGRVINAPCEWLDPLRTSFICEVQKTEKLCTLHFPHETACSASTAATKASPEVFVGVVWGEWV